MDPSDVMCQKCVGRKGLGSVARGEKGESGQKEGRKEEEMGEMGEEKGKREEAIGGMGDLLSTSSEIEVSLCKG